MYTVRGDTTAMSPKKWADTIGGTQPQCCATNGHTHSTFVVLARSLCGSWSIWPQNCNLVAVCILKKSVDKTPKIGSVNAF